MLRNSAEIFSLDILCLSYGIKTYARDISSNRKGTVERNNNNHFCNSTAIINITELDYRLLVIIFELQRNYVRQFNFIRKRKHLPVKQI